MSREARNYRLMLRNGAVRGALERFRPDLIECQDSYNLPWAAIAHRKRFPETALVARLFHRFPDRLCRAARSPRSWAGALAGAARASAIGIAAQLYRRFDAVFALSENGGADQAARRYGVEDVDVVPLGVELGDFAPSRRDRSCADRLGSTTASRC